MGLNNLISSVRWFLSCQKRRTKSLYKESKLYVFFNRFAARIDTICRITIFIKIIGSSVTD